MVRIAIQAGLPQKLDLVHEPEAAAILCFALDMENGLRASSPSGLTDETADVRSSPKVRGSLKRYPLVACDP